MNASPSSWREFTLQSVGLPSTKQIDPAKFPGEVFELYSVPSYSMDTPDLLPGCEIKSSKQIVQPDDVLLCKIVPHINRVWRVKPRGLHRQIASGEWIVVRSSSNDPDYLRYALTEPSFREQFMQTVSGVGGSLMRARPKAVAQIAVKIPQPDEQRQVVMKLDNLFARSRAAREELRRVPRLVERYKQAILNAAFSGRSMNKTRDYHDAGAHPWSIPCDWNWKKISDVAVVKSNLVATSDVQELPHIAPNHIESGIPKLLPFCTVREDGVKSAKHRFYPGQIIYSKIRPYLRKAVLVDFEGVCSADMYPIQAKCNAKFLLYWLISPDFNNLAMEHQGRTVLPKLNQDGLYRLPVPVPPFEEQEQIVSYIENAFAHIDRLVAEQDRATMLLDRLDRATLAKAFRGELVKGANSLKNSL